METALDLNYQAEDFSEKYPSAIDRKIFPHWKSRSYRSIKEAVKVSLVGQHHHRIWLSCQDGQELKLMAEGFIQHSPAKLVCIGEGQRLIDKSRFKIINLAFEHAKNGLLLISDVSQYNLPTLDIISSRLKQAANCTVIAGVSKLICTNENKYPGSWKRFCSLFDFHGELPPLVQRPEDIPALLDYFLDEYNRKRNLDQVFAQAVYGKLKKVPWTYGIEQVKEAVNGAAENSRDRAIDLADFKGYNCFF